MIFWGFNGIVPCLLDFVRWWVIRVEGQMKYYRSVTIFCRVCGSRVLFSSAYCFVEEWSDLVTLVTVCLLSFEKTFVHRIQSSWSEHRVKFEIMYCGQCRGGAREDGHSGEVYIGVNSMVSRRGMLRFVLF